MTEDDWTIEPQDPNDPVQVEAARRVTEEMKSPEAKEQHRRQLRQHMQQWLTQQWYGIHREPPS